MSTPELNSNRYNPDHNIDECEISLTFGNDKESPGHENPSPNTIFNTSNDVLDVNSSPIKRFVVPKSKGFQDTQRINFDTQSDDTQRIDVTQNLEATQRIPRVSDTQKIKFDQTQKIELSQESMDTTVADQTLGNFSYNDNHKIDTQADSQPVETQYVVTDTQVDKGEKIEFADFDTQPLKDGPGFKDDSDTTGDTRDLNLVEETQRITLDESSMIETQPVVRGVGQILQSSSPKPMPDITTDPLQIDTDPEGKSEPDRLGSDRLEPRSESNDIQIPGTVDRDRIRDYSRMQVINTQESMINENGEEEEVDTEDETTLPIDDSLLTHKLKRERDEGVESSPMDKLVGSGMNDESVDVGDDPMDPVDDPVDDLMDDPVDNPVDEESVQRDSPRVKRRKPNIIESSPDLSTDLSVSTPANPSTNLTASLTNAPHSTVEILRYEENLAITSSQVTCKHSVWAEHNFKMHTGQVQTTGKTTSVVMFIDGPLKVPNADLSPLDIRIGDKVTLKEDRIKYIVSGLSSSSTDDSKDEFKCIRGFNQVYLKRAGRRKYEEKVVSLAEVRMDLDDWFTHQQKYSVDLSTDDSLTSIIKTNMRTPTRTRQTQETKSPVKKTGGILEDCIFCITAIKDKEKLSKLIILNGGEVLDDGFMHLFEYQQTPRFELVANYEGLKTSKFAALISNHYSRSSKYLQTVALGWPIVSQRFIMDLIEEKCDFEAWPSYLLAAGLSSILKTTKSLEIFKFRNRYNSNYSLDKQIGLNNGLLKDRVILSLDKGDKQEMLETSEFIFYAFGVKHFSHFSNVSDVKKFIKNRKFGVEETLIYCNDKTMRDGMKGFKVVDWEWVVQCCISSYIWREFCE
ncbi:hypothetical protein CLIB1444_02S16336 [[Candida] jaroonii]|uniref:Uncharacterized protein n=1 Tax=[Candida] jaroonii TaxID=467808 RepID=A0ACA9Y4G7_9ASCO|nr:hypothetical protein CLIB1444_02S16336 [[Candida] jaroonii]